MKGKKQGMGKCGLVGCFEGRRIHEREVKEKGCIYRVEKSVLLEF